MLLSFFFFSLEAHFTYFLGVGCMNMWTLLPHTVTLRTEARTLFNLISEITLCESAC